MIDEKKFIENSFEKNFKIYKNKKIAIYGLGNNTKTILERCSEYNIIALLDPVKVNETVWGLPVVDIDNVCNIGIDIIVIIATSANVPIIYRRIAGKCEEYGISVFDINGDKLCRNKKKYSFDNKFYNENSELELYRLIDECDVISFDIFDTLLVRKVLYPTDIFEIISNNIFKKKCKLLNGEVDYYKARINCERELYRQCKNPTIIDIYDYISNTIGIDNDIAYAIMNMEIESESNALFARKKMLNIAKYAYELGKKICCTSDMYLTKDILASILKREGFVFLDNIFVSCEYGVSKCNGLYDILKSYCPNTKILHVGDNKDADIISAKRYGISETFHIASVAKMLDDSKISHINNGNLTLDERREIGTIIAASFNDPFIFETTKGYNFIKDNYLLGYYYFEPLLAMFIEWMVSQCKSDGIEYIFLGSRDGWLLKKMFDIRKKYKKESFEYKYLYVSRYACTLAGLITEDDVGYMMKSTFDGTSEEMLIKRFGLCEHELRERRNGEKEEDYLDRHIDIILNHAKRQRANYKKYIDTLGITKRKVGFFDFVSSGTCQLWLENICPNIQIVGYYFIRVLDAYKEKLNIKSFFESRYVYEKQSKLYKNYIFMEKVMTSYVGTLYGFNEEGNVVLENDDRTEKELTNLREVHNGILAAYEERLKNNSMNLSRDFADGILDLVRAEYSVMSADFFKNNTLKDEFCNREFVLENIINDETSYN